MRNLILVLLAGVILTGCQSQNSKVSKVSTAKHSQQKSTKIANKKIKKSAGNSVQAKIRTAARKHRVPVALALAVSHQESGHRCNIRGAAGELGPLQIKPASARGLGYRGSAKQLSKNCTAQIEFGMRHLSAAYSRGKSCWKAAYLHNAGVYAKSYKIKSARHYANSVKSKAKCS